MDLIVKLLIVQAVVFALIAFVLWELLKKELLNEALRVISGKMPDPALGEVVVVSAAAFSSVNEARFRDVIAVRFPNAAVLFATDRALKAGLVIKAGDEIIDMSFLTRVKHLFGQQDA